MTIRLLTAEMHVVDLGHKAAWAYARAAACPWYAPVRRWCLVRRARVHEREMDMWAAELYVELEAWRARHGSEAPPS